MIALHVTSVYMLPELDRNELERQCDTLMETLLRLEKADSSVRDTAVSTDLSRGRVEVEVTALGDDFEDAAARAHSRIAEAIGLITATPGPTERHLELLVS